MTTITTRTSHATDIAPSTDAQRPPTGLIRRGPGRMAAQADRLPPPWHPVSAGDRRLDGAA